jgi:hypothetical protein
VKHRKGSVPQSCKPTQVIVDTSIRILADSPKNFLAASRICVYRHGAAQPDAEMSRLLAFYKHKKCERLQLSLRHAYCCLPVCAKQQSHGTMYSMRASRYVARHAVIHTPLPSG